MSETTAPRPSAVIVLAAGQGTRMKSATPKVMHTIGGRSLVGHALHAAASLDPEHLVAVVRHEREKVAAHIEEQLPGIAIADQDEIPGTGRAVELGLEAVPAETEGTVVVTYGDVPLLTPETLANLVSTHEADGNAVTVLTATLEDPTGYGRIVRDAAGLVERIMEHKDAVAHAESTGDSSFVEIAEVNSGIYAFDAALLRRTLPTLSTDNVQGEKYLTDVLGLARAEGGRVASVGTDDVWEVEGANDRRQLSDLGRQLNDRVLRHWMKEGVTVIDPSSTWVDVTVQLSNDVLLKPGTQLHGTTTVGADAVIGPDTTLTDTEVGAGATVKRTDATGAVIDANATVGPFTYLRPGTVLGEDGKIGAFYETKNVTVGRGAKLSHLGYAGDAEIGEYTNIGCGNITANYDGVNKYRTTIGAHVRTGSNTVFTAPVTVGDGAYTGAGAVVREDVPAGALALNRVEQRIIDGWVVAKRPGTGSADAAEAAGADRD
ncbi:MULTISPECIES: bifunctional UDP-N-acetylglucosamine diphosphorylase/glucosamine-1-phosphate N-acetyltransferase GlmU [Micrococcus]|uniref:Bifunctional protein GlmU n=1 Tax=Micrococcus lylae TaxID=1273 RepID=A0ABY2K317_9MICC|nr:MULTISPECIES: bifunctional UDP-N-acetylglucosamine diphosphorylase/glucosamine-1-phosphate N-acetyltransferase GlmU [Micrococcus]OFR90798.1 bifunctional N-acetylglucosamine-1-phosphate uridyltransferase/glucosamine-1-phosphate acetyltransferase [Micrococcus sp. HMSC067E09]TFI01188.1 bifunctional UDP-N-acetylglucosamine diphosphorylase/glucosamine-1-phosphate N-acetyltransferase GlmU [Micrococcus lylae]WIK82355.1 bifunctional UDP-N-acetylglucosamine diphosphorylase/glucosamine-1-phosphate N-ac